MSNLPHAKGFQELLVYQKARQLAKDIFRMTISFPKEEILDQSDPPIVTIGWSKPCRSMGEAAV